MIPRHASRRGLSFIEVVISLAILTGILAIGGLLRTRGTARR